MVQWRLVCGITALYAVGTVKGLPIEEDQTDVIEDLVVMNENFPGSSDYKPPNSPVTVTTTDTGSIAGEGEYLPGAVHPSMRHRRLEGTKSRDMKKLETYFGIDLETDITLLPAKYEHDPIPWPSSYWPTYADSINYRWDKKQPSPAEKYAVAFGHDVKTIMDTISAKKGIDSMTKRKTCTEDAECKKLKDNSVCAKREGKETGHCIPTWFGICHAWAPAAILEAEPVCAVERNGTVFEPYDIKGLITLAYDGSKIPTIFTGTRFNGNDKGDNITDEFGRYIDDTRRDISPGFFHIAITNIMGRFNSSFVIDITAGNEVWNQPVRSYEILRLLWTTPAAAAKKYFKLDKYPFNDAATKIAVVTTRFRWIVESGVNGPLVSTGLVDKYTTSADYEYILETDETYQILGGEWLSGSMANHIDFLWIAAQKPDNFTVTPTGLVYSEIESLVVESSSGNCKPTSTGGKSSTSSSQLNDITITAPSSDSSNAALTEDHSTDSDEPGSTESSGDAPPAEITAETDSSNPGNTESSGEASPPVVNFELTDSSNPGYTESSGDAPPAEITAETDLSNPGNTESSGEAPPPVVNFDLADSSKPGSSGEAPPAELNAETESSNPDNTESPAEDPPAERSAELPNPESSGDAPPAEIPAGEADSFKLGSSGDAPAAEVSAPDQSSS